jgi:RNA polymerase sigma-70 factor (ECF subfamily)
MNRTEVETMELLTVCDYATRTDEELVLEYRNVGDREAFNQLVHRYERSLFSFLMRSLNSSDQAEDVFQNTFIKVAKNAHLFDASRKFKSWLFKIASNETIMYRRETGYRFSIVSIDENYNQASENTELANFIEGNETTPLENSIAAEETQRVRDAIAQLPEMYRQTIYLVYFQGLSYAEAADALGIAKGSMPSRLHYAIQNLTTMLKRSSFEYENHC